MTYKQINTLSNEQLLARIAKDLTAHGHCIIPAGLPEKLGNSLAEQLSCINDVDFHRAGVGRNSDLKRNTSIRKDEIFWINNETNAGREWLRWAEEIQLFLNRELYLGLFSFESHFSHYAVGDYYKRHLDAFKGSSNRVLSLVTYLNDSWKKEDGGELVLYKNDRDENGIKVLPEFGTLVIFLSEEFPHEVLPALQDRYAIAGWFHINA